MEKLAKLHRSLLGFALLRGILSAPVLEKLMAVMEAPEASPARLSAYGSLVSHIYENGDGRLSDCVRRVLFENENLYVRTVAAGGEVPEGIYATLCHELAVLSEAASLSPADFACSMEKDAFLPAFLSEDCDLACEYLRRAESLHCYGYGIFASHAMFRINKDNNIRPIGSADPVAMGNFVGYEAERAKVLSNTEAFLAGRPAANVLLYGDAGTGKSSTVKAIVNSLFDRGLRLIELRRDQLLLLPRVMEEISRNPLKFIIFIDDLTFQSGDDRFGMLKATLEGSASAKAKNAVIYATSNRRHIIRESFSEREGSDVHRNDTVQETLSLSERFGLSVLFAKPDKALYLDIVCRLAARAGLKRDPDELARAAEEFALRRGYRSARCAEQFVRSLL